MAPTSGSYGLPMFAWSWFIKFLINSLSKNVFLPETFFWDSKKKTLKLKKCEECQLDEKNVSEP